MITLRRAMERHHDGRRKQEVWLTFHAQDRAKPLEQFPSLGDRFGSLEMFNEHLLPPGSSILRGQPRNAEVITYVRNGALAHGNSIGRSGVITAGEFHRMTLSASGRHTESNASRTEWAHIFQIWLRPEQAGLEPSYEQRRFSMADRRGEFCVVASPDGRNRSLRIAQAALIYSTLLYPGQHVVHELLSGRMAWIHLVKGEATFGDIVLTGGDGAGVTEERALSFTAREECEMLLIDLSQPPNQPFQT